MQVGSDEATESEGLRKGDFLAGKYLLEDCLGVGGFGEVYRATNVSLGRKVAIKLLNREMTKNEADVLRFLREARAAAAVRHPNVVDVLDVAREDDGTPFIVQELLSGQDLEQYVTASGRLSIAEAIEIMTPVADAVAAAHARDVVHRDLKPANIFLSRDGGRITPKVLDFGACIYSTMSGDVAPDKAILIGTPHYMAPEQVNRKSTIDPRVDVWAIGVILYELLIGETPFEAETTPAVLKLVRTRDVPRLRKVRPEAPEELEALVAKCTERARDDRYANAGQVRSQLEEIRLRLAGATRQRIETTPDLDEAFAPPKPVVRTKRRLSSLLSLSSVDELDIQLDISPPTSSADARRPPRAGSSPRVDPRVEALSEPPAAVRSSSPPRQDSIPPILDPRAASGRMLSSPAIPAPASTTSPISVPPPQLSSSRLVAKTPVSDAPPVTKPRASAASLASIDNVKAAAPAAEQANAETMPRREELRLALTVTLPALVLYLVFRFVPFVDAPIGKAMRGESAIASGLFAIVALVGAAVLGGQSLMATERSKSTMFAAVAALLLGVIMIIVTFSATESAELGISPPLAGAVPWIAMLVPFALGIGAFERARTMWLVSYTRDDAKWVALFGAAMLFLALELGPIGAVRSHSGPTQAPAVPAASP